MSSAAPPSNLLNILLANNTSGGSTVNPLPPPLPDIPANSSINDPDADMLKFFDRKKQSNTQSHQGTSGEDLLKTVFSHEDLKDKEREGRSLMVLEGLFTGGEESGRESGMSGSGMSGSDVGGVSFPSFPHSSLSLPLQSSTIRAPIAPNYTFPVSSPSTSSEIPTSTSVPSSSAIKSPFDFISPFDVMERNFHQPQISSFSSVQTTSQRQAIQPAQIPLPNKASPVPSHENESLPSTTSTGKKKEEFLDDSPEVLARKKWMAKEYRDEGIQAFGGKKKTGYKIPPSTEPITIDCSKPLVESLYTQDIVLTAITLFTTPVKMDLGRKMAVTRDGFISYATKQGRVRVIDRNTGARLLLKSHSMPIIDMAVSKVEGRSLLSSGIRTESLATCGGDGKLILWKVPSNFQDDTAEHKISVEILSNNQGSVSGVQWHPTRRDTLAVKTLDGGLAIIDFEKDVGGSVLNGRGRLSWDEALKGQSSITLASPVRLMTFSPDGSLLAVYTDDGYLSIRGTEALERVLYQSRTKLAHLPSDISRVEFITAPGTHPKYISISRNNGTRVEIFELPNLHRSILQIDFTASQAPHLPPIDINASLFCHAYFKTDVSTLFVSNSLRASVFAFHLQFPRSLESERDLRSSDAQFIERIFQQTPEGNPNSPDLLPVPYVDYVVEIPSVEPVISFTLDEVASDQERDDGAPMSLFTSHPKGINQMYLERAVVDPKYQPEQKVETEEDELLNFDRRQSLESSIQVQVETEVAVDGGTVRLQHQLNNEEVSCDLLTMEQTLGSPKVAQLGEVAEMENAASVSGMKLAGPVINGAIKNMKKEKGSTAKIETLLSSVPRDKDHLSKKNEAEGTGWKDLKRLEDNLTNKIGKLFMKEMDKFQQRAEEERASANAVDLNRQEHILRLVSNSLSGNTKKLLESTVKTEIKNVVLPSISKTIAEAVSDQISKGVSDSLRKTLPSELERLLLRPDVSTHMAKHFGSTVAPLVERNVQNIIQQTVVPRFRDGTQAMLESLMQEVRSEMVDVRKEIEAEQSEVLRGQENELRDLRETIDGLRAQMANMEKMLARMNVYNGQSHSHELQSGQPLHPKHVHAPRATGSSSSSQATPPTSKPPPMQPTKFSGLRATTPVASYEDFFLNALSSPHNSLAGLIDQAPPHRLNAIFGPAGNEPVISQAVILTMAHKIATELDSMDGPLLDIGKRRLSWLWYCITATDVNDQSVSGYVSRIFNLVRTYLLNRQKKLEAIDDIDGAMTISDVVNALQAKIP